MNYDIPSQVNNALTLLNNAGFSAFIVGGAVRDLVMGKTPHDWDITTSARPEQTEEVFKEFRIIETGIQHGTVTVLLDNIPLEITTYRIEKGYSDRRRPDEVLFSQSLNEDLSRRDFTCNALAYHPDEGIIDNFGGYEDIQNKIIRCVGEPDRRFNEDALRILRALRFSSVLGFEIDEATSESIRKNYNLLEFVSCERIFSELSKLLCGVNVAPILDDYKDVIFFLMPELAATDGCVQHHERHIYDVWHHIIKSVESVRNDSVLRFTALFHDSGKPNMKFTDKNGVDHFWDHPDVSAVYADDILKRFKTSNKFRNDVVVLVKNHEFLPDKVSKKDYRKFIGQYGIEMLNLELEFREADFRAQNLIFLNESLNCLETGKKIINEIIISDSCYSLKDLKISGNDLITLNIESLKIGEILNILLDEVMDDKIKNEKSALLNRAKELI